MTDMMTDSALRILADHCTPQTIRAFEKGAPATALWQDFEEAGFLDALIPEAAGGAGLSAADMAPILRGFGRFLSPLPFAQTMVARAILAQSSYPLPAGPILLSTALPAMATPLRELAATLNALEMAGAMERVLEISIEYVNLRTQFGRSIGKFQVIQHQLAVMAEQVVLARTAAQMACPTSGFLPSPLLAAIAKHRASASAVQVAAIAHAVHGAMGMTEEYDLQLYTRRLQAWRLANGSEAYWADRIGAARLAAPAKSSIDFVRSITEWESVG